MMLVADIGGTNARFALAEFAGGAPRLHDLHTLRAADFETVQDGVLTYLKGASAHPKHACFAVAAPLDGDDITFTNSHWSFSKTQMKSEMGFAHFNVLNDFAALATGIVAVPRDFLTEVRAGTPDPKAPKLVIGPGTGLGQAIIVPNGKQEIIVPTQGGHVSFAPRSERELDIWAILKQEHPRVTAEHLLSGRGLVSIHRALCHIEGAPSTALQPNQITQATGKNTEPLADEAVNIFCNILGAVAGDALLSTGARGGVFLAGGILPKIKDAFLASDFETHFLDKDPMQGYVAPVPVTLIGKDGAGLYGAAIHLNRQMV